MKLAVCTELIASFRLFPILPNSVRVGVAFSRHRVKPSVHVVDACISSLSIFKHLCILNLTSKTEGRKSILKGEIIILLNRNSSPVAFLSPFLEER